MPSPTNYQLTIANAKLQAENMQLHSDNERLAHRCAQLEIAVDEAIDAVQSALAAAHGYQKIVQLKEKTR